MPLSGLYGSVSAQDWQGWLLLSVAVVPGFSQLLQRRWRRAALLLTATIAFLIAIILLINHPLSDVLLWLVLALSVYSVWDVADRTFPAANGRETARHLRALRLLLMSVGIVAGTVLAVCAVLGRWYELWVFQTNGAAPVFRIGDGIVVQRRGSPDQPLRRGDVVVYVTDSPYGNTPMTERIVGLPGDWVTSQGDTLLVNGWPVPRERLPLTLGAPSMPLAVRVPADQVCIWRSVNRGNEPPENPGIAPYALVSTRDLRGRAIARYQPPGRRRWFP
jgi:signal peptidase I